MFSRSLMCPKDVLHGTPQVVCIIHPKDVHHVPQRAQKPKHSSAKGATCAPTQHVPTHFPV